MKLTDRDDFGYGRFIKGLQTDASLTSLNLPIIPTFCDIANLIECVAMFLFHVESIFNDFIAETQLYKKNNGATIPYEKEGAKKLLLGSERIRKGVRLG